jgi:hypothetical protein
MTRKSEEEERSLMQVSFMQGSFMQVSFMQSRLRQDTSCKV